MCFIGYQEHILPATLFSRLTVHPCPHASPRPRSRQDARRCFHRQHHRGHVRVWVLISVRLEWGWRIMTARLFGITSLQAFIFFKGNNGDSKRFKQLVNTHVFVFLLLSWSVHNSWLRSPFYGKFCWRKYTLMSRLESSVKTFFLKKGFGPTSRYVHDPWRILLLDHQLLCVLRLWTANVVSWHIPFLSHLTEVPRLCRSLLVIIPFIVLHASPLIWTHLHDT